MYCLTDLIFPPKIKTRASFDNEELWVTPDSEPIIIRYALKGPYPEFPDSPFYEKAGSQLTKGVPRYPEEDLIRTMQVFDFIPMVVNKYLNPLIYPHRLLNVKLTDDEEKNAAILKNVDIITTFDPNRSTFSAIGRSSIGMNPSMNFVIYSVSTILHEFCHALGMYHEHERITKPYTFTLTDECFKAMGWKDTPEMRERIKRNITSLNTNTTDSEAYDPDSIMLYNFAPECISTKTAVVRQNVLSNMDKIWLMKMFRSNKYPVPPSISESSLGLKIGLGVAAFVVFIIILVLAFVYFKRSRNSNISYRYSRLKQD